MQKAKKEGEVPLDSTILSPIQSLDSTFLNGTKNGYPFPLLVFSEKLKGI